MDRSDLVFVGISGTVVALDRDTGEEVWRMKLKGDFVNLFLQDGDLFAAGAGELFCLDSRNGRVRWQNPLKGLGRGLITFASSGGQEIVAMRRKRQDDEAAATQSTIG